MQYTNEQIAKAIQLAERLAKAETCKQTFTAAATEENTYATVIDSATDSIGSCHEKLLKDEDRLAEQLLPQARVITKMEFDRRMALSEMSFGELLTALTHQHTIEEEGSGWGDNSAPFKFPLDNEEWAKFLSALEKGKKVEMLSALTAILVSIQEDLVETTLPPVAPVYEIPE